MPRAQPKPPECGIATWLLFNSGKMLHNLGMESGTIQTVYEAAGGLDALVRLAHAWHTRVL
jgi:hypothetical protein